MLVLGDAHAATRDRRRSLYAAYRAAAADVAVQAGDLMYYAPPVETYFIGGNNEDFDVVEALRRGVDPGPGVSNVHLLDGAVHDVEGVRVTGVSGNFAPTVFDEPRSVLAGDRRRHFVAADLERAAALEDVDVLVLHEGPVGLPVEEEYEPGCEHVNRLLRALEPELVLVGHHHQHARATIEGCRVVALAPAWERYYTLDPADLVLTAHETPPA
ncbi:MAG: metallophosphoesterase [Halobacteriaceae archaeon]